MCYTNSIKKLQKQVMEIQQMTRLSDLKEKLIIKDKVMAWGGQMA